jgi:DNA polymerase (family 10)
MLYKGFGEKTQKNVADAIEFFMRHQGHFLYADVESYAEHVLQVLTSNFPKNQFAICGDYVRQLPTLDELVWLTDADFDLVKAFLIDNQFSVGVKDERSLEAKGPENLRMVFHFTSTTDFTKEQFRLTGSAEFIEAWDARFSNHPNAYPTENNWQSLLGIHYIPTCLRENAEIIEQAKTDSFNQLIQVNQIKGIIHSHSNWSDGSNTIEEMALACIAQGFEYLVISDHSKSAFYANGLNEERIKAQHQYIDELNNKLAPFKIFKSVESDILNDGALDYSDNLLSTFDMVIASVHSNLKMSEEKAMSRLLTAIENPYTTVLGHPTGRLLLSRKGYPIDHEKIIDACIANNVVIEINAHPRRLDLDWTWISKAQDMGAILSINPDAHYVEGYKDIKYGVLAAQKGGLRKQHNLSSYSLQEIETYLSRVRKA